MEAIKIEGKKREKLGKKYTKQVRNEGLIPCVLYGGKEPMHFTVTANGVKDIIYTPNFYCAEINLDGSQYKAIIKDLQFHPVTDRILHIDFLELVSGVKVKTEIPIRTTGVAAGVREGGKLMLKVRKLKVKTTPEQLKDAVIIDVSDLKLGQSFKVRDIQDTGMEIMTSMSIPVASVEVPRSLRSASSELEEEGDVATSEETEATATEGTE